MKNGIRLLDLFNVALATTLMATLLGCAAYVGDGYYGGGVDTTVVVPGPVFYGDIHERGHVVHDYRRRGYESRGVVHGERRDRH